MYTHSVTLSTLLHECTHTLSLDCTHAHYKGFLGFCFPRSTSFTLLHLLNMHTLSPLYNTSYTGVPLARTPHSTTCSCNCRFSILLNIFTLYSITLLHAHFTTHIITLFSITFLHAYMTTVNHSFPSRYYTYILLQINHSFAISLLHAPYRCAPQTDNLFNNVEMRLSVDLDRPSTSTLAGMKHIFLRCSLYKHVPYMCVP